MTKINFKKLFYNTDFSSRDFIDSVDSVINSERISASAIPFGCTRPINDLLVDGLYGNRALKKIGENNGIGLFKLKHDFFDDNTKSTISGQFFIYPHPSLLNIYIAVTIESSEFFHRELTPFLKSLYPGVIFSSISHKQLRSLIEDFKITNDFSEIKVIRASCRSRVHNQKEEKVISTVSWLKMNLDEAFNWVYENNGWFKSIQFEAIRGDVTIAHVLMTRKGIVRTDRYFKKSYTSFLEPICSNLNSNINLLKNRSRKENTSFEVKPLVVTFDEDKFENVSENKIFIDALQQIKSASVSVLHGNPYIHISLLDYIDGSSFDIWALEKNQIVIVPQMKGTVESIKRLVNHIYDTFAEGEIRDYDQIGV